MRKIWQLKIFFPELLVSFLFWYLFCLPEPLFADPYSTVLFDRNGMLLSSRISSDGQWRFPENKVVPEKFATALIEFEDKEFYKHPGVSARGIGRAIVQNSKSFSIKSGGSTLTMQLARMARKQKSRGLWDKIMESILATRIELRYTKQEILSLYTAHAPFGGNVVGLEAASWRYFGRPAHKLSWAESATLAVLPNAPSLIFPGKNEKRLLNKRNRLLKSLNQHGKITNEQYTLALTEPLPGKPFPLPQLATQLIDHAMKDGFREKFIYSSIDRHLQELVLQSLQRYHHEYIQHEVHNLSSLIIDLKTGKVIAYVGNTSDLEGGGTEASAVNCITAPRSTGSILKPFLFATALRDGEITPQSLIPDIPTHISGFSPKNFNQTYDGAVESRMALARSLNVPMVRLLAQHGVQNFHQELKDLGFSHINRPANHYGLALVLGGAETSLWDVCKAYAGQVRHLNNALQGSKEKILDISYLNSGNSSIKSPKPILSPAVTYSMLEAMVEVNRPGEESNWRYLGNGNKVAWKTGTSYGFRDAWSIGITRDYLVGVWVGNADGEGRPGLTGISMAAPILFDLIDKLPRSAWFNKPTGMLPISICSKSGFRATENCEKADTVVLPRECVSVAACPYHEIILTTGNKNYRVNQDCVENENYQEVSWFILPPAMEMFYKMKSPDYQSLPAWKPGCTPTEKVENLSLIYPRKNSKITIPVGIDGELTSAVFEANHRRNNATIYWHLDDDFLGKTFEIHQINLQPSPGKHRLMLIDDLGESTTASFEVK